MKFKLSSLLLLLRRLGSICRGRTSRSSTSINNKGLDKMTATTGLLHTTTTATDGSNNNNNTHGSNDNNCVKDSSSGSSSSSCGRVGLENVMVDEHEINTGSITSCMSNKSKSKHAVVRFRNERTSLEMIQRISRLSTYDVREVVSVWGSKEERRKRKQSLKQDLMQ